MSDKKNTPDTNREFEEVIGVCRALYVKKLQDYGASWRIMRPESPCVRESRIPALCIHRPPGSFF